MKAVQEIKCADGTTLGTALPTQSAAASSFAIADDGLPSEHEISCRHLPLLLFDFQVHSEGSLGNRDVERFQFLSFSQIKGCWVVSPSSGCASIHLVTTFFACCCCQFGHFSHIDVVCAAHSDVFNVALLAFVHIHETQHEWDIKSHLLHGACLDQ